MKKKKTIEMQIYELLGVKVFRKMAFALRDTLSFPLTIKMSKEERKNFLYNTASNYNIGKTRNLENIKKFKKELFKNAGIHIFGLLFCLINVLKDTGIIATIDLIFLIINNYCIMLQRYNCIRINELIERKTKRQKAKLKENLIKEDSLLLKHNYKIIDENERETSITFDDLIANANIEQLKRYRAYLAYFKIVNQITEKNVNINIPINNKTLKLELKKQ